MNHYIMAQAIYQERKQFVEKVNKNNWKNNQSPEIIVPTKGTIKGQPNPSFKVQVQS